MKAYEIKAQQRQPRFKNDNSITLSYDTGEISITDKTAILEKAGALGSLFFVPDGSEQFDIDKIDAEMEGKSPTERLYNVLYVYWKQLTSKGKETRLFDEFRRFHMERFIELIKKQLE